jgi:hypothetical protein
MGGMVHNGRRYETLGISEPLHYQGTANFDARTKARITTSPPMFYDRVLGNVYLLSNFNFKPIVKINILKFNNRAIQANGLSNIYTIEKIPLIARKTPINKMGVDKKTNCSTFFNNKTRINPDKINEVPQIKLMYIIAFKSPGVRQASPPFINGVNVAISWIIPKIKMAMANILPREISVLVFICVFF